MTTRPAPPSAKKSKRSSRHPLLWTILLACAVTFFGWSKIRSRYEQWNAVGNVRRAGESLAQGNLARAVLDAKLALDVNPMDPQATLIMARVLESAGSPALAAQWRSRLDTLTPGDPENIVAWASDAMKGGDPAAAERILAMLKPEPSDNATYHATAAAVAAGKKDNASAERHWTEALRIAPHEDDYRLKLALVRLASKTADGRADALKMLRELIPSPTAGADALRALLADATDNADFARASEYSDALTAHAGSTFSDKLTRLGLLRQMKSRAATGYLMDLQNAALRNPADLYLLFMWMNQHGLTLMVLEWSRTLPPDALADPSVCVAVADACVRNSDWKRLQEYVSGRAWPDLDFMRRGFLAYALERRGETQRAEQEWRDGVSDARSRGDINLRLEKMVRLAIGWGWEQRAQEVMWSMVGSPTCPRWMLDALWQIAIENSHTAQLQKLAAILAKADSKSVICRNNYAFYSLLVHSEDGDPHREAERLFHENPRDTSVIITRSLSLFQQGKSQEALALTASLPAAELRKPRIALYHGIFLTLEGDAAAAAGFIALAQSGKIFPEEKAMLERTKVAVVNAAEEAEIAEAAKKAREAKAAMDLEKEKAVETARAARAAQAAKEARDAEAGKTPKTPK